MSTRLMPVCVAGVVVSWMMICLEGSAQAAIAFVATSSAQTAAGGAASLSLAKPTGVAAGQVEIATLSVQGSSPIAPPAGWTKIIDTQVGASLRQASFRHVAGASEATTSWTLSPSTQAVGGIVAYSGVDTTTIVDNAAEQTGTSGKTVTIPSVTASYSGDLVLGVGSFNNQGTLSGDPAASPRYSAVVPTANGPALGAQDATAPSAGATPTQTGSDSTAATALIGQAIALKAAGAAGVLSVQTSATPSFGADLNAGDQTPTFTLPLSIAASVAPPPGWRATITSTQFSAGTHNLGGGASTIASAPAAVCDDAYANCVAPTNAVSYPVTVPAGSGPPAAVTFFNAAAGTGAGRFTLTPTESVAVPQNSYAGTYSSTLTVAIVSGP